MSGAKQSILNFLPHMIGDIEFTSPLNCIRLRVLILVHCIGVFFDRLQISHGYVLLGLRSEKGLKLYSNSIGNSKRFEGMMTRNSASNCSALKGCVS